MSTIKHLSFDWPWEVKTREVRDCTDKDMSVDAIIERLTKSFDLDISCQKPQKVMTPNEVLENTDREETCEKSVESFDKNLDIETFCEKCRMFSVENECVLEKAGITCGHCGHYCEIDKLQYIP